MPATIALIPIIVSSYAGTVLGANLLYIGTTELRFAWGIIR